MGVTMKLNLSKPEEGIKGTVYFNKLLKDGSKIELRKIAPKRSIDQNSYVHVLFTLWGFHFGYTTTEAKQVVKDHLGYTYVKNGIKFYAKTSEMDTKVISVFIDKFRNFSSHEGCYLPTAEEYKMRHFDYSQEAERAEQIQDRYGF